MSGSWNLLEMNYLHEQFEEDNLSNGKPSSFAPTFGSFFSSFLLLKQNSACRQAVKFLIRSLTDAMF